MQSILAILEIVKTSAAICASEKLEERNKLLAGDIMNTCLQMLQKEVNTLSLAQSNIQLPNQ